MTTRTRKSARSVPSDQVQVRFRHRGGAGFFSLSNRIVDEWGRVLTAGGLAVYTVMARHANNESSHAWMSQQTIAECLGLTRQTVGEYLSDIVALGLAERFEERMPDGSVRHTYELLPVGPCSIAPDQSPYARRSQSRKVKAQVAKAVGAEVNYSVGAELNNLTGPCLIFRQNEDSREKKTHTPAPVGSDVCGPSSDTQVPQTVQDEPSPPDEPTPPAEDAPDPDPDSEPSASDLWESIPSAPLSVRAGLPGFTNDHAGWYAGLVYVTTGWSVSRFEQERPQSVQKQYHGTAKYHQTKGRHVRDLIDHYAPGFWWSQAYAWTKRDRPRLDDIGKTWNEWEQSPVGSADASLAAKTRALEAQADDDRPQTLAGQILAGLTPRRRDSLRPATTG